MIRGVFTDAAPRRGSVRGIQLEPPNDTDGLLCFGGFLEKFFSMPNSGLIGLTFKAAFMGFSKV